MHALDSALELAILHVVVALVVPLVEEDITDAEVVAGVVGLHVPAHVNLLV